jgi:hypothetical protein
MFFAVTGRKGWFLTPIEFLVPGLPMDLIPRLSKQPRRYLGWKAGSTLAWQTWMQSKIQMGRRSFLIKELPKKSIEPS